MAEEGIHLLVTQKISKPGVASSRRNSTGNFVPPIGEEKILPRYMRASIGSCHDFCKYGRKHAIEEKARCPFPKRIVTKPSNDQNSSESLDLPQRKVTSAVKFDRSSASKDHAHGTYDILKPEVNIKSNQIKNSRKDEAVMEKKVSTLGPRSSLNSKSYSSDTIRPSKQVQSSFEKVRVSSKSASPKAKERSLSGEGTALSKLKYLTEKKISSTTPSEGSRAKQTIRGGQTSVDKRAMTSKVSSRKISTSPRASLALRHSISRAASLTARTHKSLKALSALKNQNKTSMDEAQPDIKETNKDEPEEKTLYVIKMETEDRTFESDKNENCALGSSPPLESATKVCAIKMEAKDKVLESDKRETCTVDSPPHLSFSPRSPSLPTCPPFSSTSEVDEVESENTESGAEDGSVSEYDEPVNMEESGLLKGEKRASDKECKPVKLRFRRGKVVDIQAENNGVKRLRFRRARVLGANLTDKAEGCRSFRKREVGDDSNDEKSGGEKVVLRHQDVEGKKDDQGLFNNVIEETASKLVESRKSKVKALVGAFETVISLQDSKPSANVVT